jgi:hypothetical protein
LRWLGSPLQAPRRGCTLRHPALAFVGDSATTRRIIAACVPRAVAGAGHVAYLVEAIRPKATIRPQRGNLNSLRGLLTAQQQEVIAMKLIIATLATVFALAGPAFAQSSSDGLNGSTLGKSMRGVNNGVPYPNTNATEGTGRGGGGGVMYHGHHRHHWKHHWHHRHHRPYKHSGM